MRISDWSSDVCSSDLSAGEGYALGPVKLLLDEADLPPVETVAARIAAARSLGRNVAAHCVTLGELLFYLEALAQAGGSQPGDRIEHGAMIAESLIGDIAAAGLTVVTRSEEHTSELQSLMRISYAVFGLKK